MLSTGLNTLLEFIGAGNVAAIRQACGSVMISLASHQDIALLILDHAMPTLMDLKNLNSDCKVNHMNSLILYYMATYLHRLNCYLKLVACKNKLM